jgi:hypothetical protein
VRTDLQGAGSGPDEIEQNGWLAQERTKAARVKAASVGSNSPKDSARPAEGRSIKHLQAEHMAAPTNPAKREETSCQLGAVHTWHI